jgi:DMSO/TMAO reductase YedYZ molybdopterin-dependent catalytic subunit
MKGILAGLLAATAMTVFMLVLAMFGIATPLTIIGDRISVFFSPGPFLELMGRVGGYNHLKQLGVGSTIAGQLLFGAIGGGIYGMFLRNRSARWTMSIFVVLPLIVFAVALWPVLGTNYRGLPIDPARLTTTIAFALSLLIYERTLVYAFHLVTSGWTRAAASQTPNGDTTARVPPDMVSRRALILSGLGLLIAGGGAALLRKLYRVATFSYDGTQYKGRIVQPITPNDLFYCVTKNVIDPTVDENIWHLEVSGLVQTPRTYRLQDFKNAPQVEQETTLMCISNGLDAGLISNAMWRGVPLRDVLQTVGPLSDAARVRLCGVDNYTDTIALEKAMEETTLLALEMNGVPLPQRHGFPLRAIVPGFFGEKHVKWLTRIELTTADAKGFYETQGWGPDFICPTRSRIDVPDHESSFSLGQLKAPIEVKGMAYGGDRGISRVELSFDDGQTWNDAEIYYKGSDLAWSLWKMNWTPNGLADYTLVVRATDGEGDVQEWEADRSPFSGATGFHKIRVHVTA